MPKQEMSASAEAGTASHGVGPWTEPKSMKRTAGRSGGGGSVVVVLVEEFDPSTEDWVVLVFDNDILNFNIELIAGINL
jgi:hypothetical protein